MQIYDYDRGYVGFSAAIHAPPSWLELHWREIALACGGSIVLFAAASGMCSWRRERRRSARLMSVAIHWSDPLAEPVPLF